MNTRKTSFFGILGKTFLYLWVGFSLFVFLWIGMSAFKTNKDFFDNVWALPKPPSFNNYLGILRSESSDLMGSFRNSVVLVVTSVFGLLAVSAPAAYLLSRFEFFFSKKIKFFIIFGMGIPFQLLIIPLFSLLFRLKLINSLLGLGLVYVSLSIPFTVYLLAAFYASLPRGLEEAARIDGCTPIGTFFRIMLPISTNGLATAAVLNFVGLWNEFLFAITLIYDKKLSTLSLSLYAIQGGLQYSGNWVGMMAAFTLVTLPAFLLYLFLSRTIMRGMATGGALKG